MQGRSARRESSFAAEEANCRHWLSVEDQLVIQYLLPHAEINLPTAAEICQQHDRKAREGLHRLEGRYQIVEIHRRGKVTV